MRHFWLLPRSIIGTVLALLLSAATPLQANSKNFLQNGLNAATYGDLTMDKGSWRGESISGVRLKVGVQLFRVKMVGLTVGFQKNGFYTATRNFDRTQGSTTYDYRGPVAELHIFPGEMFSGSIASSFNKGYFYRKESDPALYGYGACGCTLVSERSELKVNELTAQLGYRFAEQMELTLGFGTRNVKGHPELESYTDNPKAATYLDHSAGKWEGTESFVFFGIRGTAL